MRTVDRTPGVATAAPARPVAPVDLVAAGVISAAGVGLDALGDALRAGRAEGGRPDATRDTETYPSVELRAADFAAADLLGRKGLSRLTRADQLGAAACGLALDSVADPAGTGVVLGTSLGSCGAVARFARDTFVQERPYLVNPSDFPGTLMNSAAGRTAIRHRLTDVNATVSGGPLASLHALRYARQTLLAGHARRILAGGVEELSPQSAWAWHRTGALAPRVALGEGAAVFALESPGERRGAGTPPLARLMACTTGFADVARGALVVGQRLTACVEDALRRSGLTAQDVAVVAPGAAGRRGWAAVEERALRAVLPATTDRHRLRVHAVLGETHGAGAALQVAGVLARWQDPRLDTRHEHAALVTSCGPDGSVGCAVLVRANAPV